MHRAEKNMMLKSQKVKIVRKSHVINKDTNVQWGAIMPNSASRHKRTKTRNKDMQLWEITMLFWESHKCDI